MKDWVTSLVSDAELPSGFAVIGDPGIGVEAVTSETGREITVTATVRLRHFDSEAEQTHTPTADDGATLADRLERALNAGDEFDTADLRALIVHARRTVQGEPTAERCHWCGHPAKGAAEWQGDGDRYASCGAEFHGSDFAPAPRAEPQGEPSDAQALEDFLAKLAGPGAYTLDFTSAESLHGCIVSLLKRDISALRAAGVSGDERAKQ